MKNFQCFKPTNSQHTLQFHPLTTQYFPTRTNMVEIQAQEITRCSSDNHLQNFSFRCFWKDRLCTGRGHTLGARKGARPSRDTLLGHLDHWLRLTRRQKGAHLNNYEIDLGYDTLGGTRKTFIGTVEIRLSSLDPQPDQQPLPQTHSEGSWPKKNKNPTRHLSFS